jgi:3-dehydroquinate dehydratase-2
MKKILMLHGVNHNMFGKRDPVQYGTITLAEIDAKMREVAPELGVEVVRYQTNHEGAMCERIHQAFVEKMVLARPEHPVQWPRVPVESYASYF